MMILKANYHSMRLGVYMVILLYVSLPLSIGSPLEDKKKQWVMA